ncbi:Sucrose synthase 5 [Glycine soja]
MQKILNSPPCSLSLSLSVRASITVEIPTKPVKIQRHRYSLLTRLTRILHRRKLSSFSFKHGIYILLIRDTTKLPGGSLNLKFLCVSHLYFSGPEARFERLPKLVRATIAIGHVLLEDKEEADLILEFQNLTHLELGYSDYTRDWIERLEVIKRFPNLQILDIDMGSIDMNARGDEGADWPFPRSVPSCISLHLKTCEEEEETKKQRKVVLGVAITLFYASSISRTPRLANSEKSRFGICKGFKEWGFDKGWGNIAGRVKETMKLLYEVVYILDQVRALEEELLHKIELQVLDVKPQILVVSY